MMVSGIWKPSRSNTCLRRACEARSPSIAAILGGAWVPLTVLGKRLRTGLANVNCRRILLKVSALAEHGRVHSVSTEISGP